MVARLRNLHIAIKVFLAPALLIASMAVLAVIFQLGISRQGGALVDLYEGSVNKDKVIARLEVGSVGVQSNLYRLLGWQNSGVDKPKVAALEKKIVADLATLEGIYATYRASVSDDAEAKLADAIQTRISTFKAAVRDVLEMYTIDDVTALVLMVNTEQQYDGMIIALRAVAEAGDQHTAQVYGQAKAVAVTAQQTYYIIFAVFLTLGIAVTVILARLITRPVSELTGVMGHLAQGHTDQTIPFQDGREEIGAMARAVAVFRDNMVKARELENREAEERERGAARFARRESILARFDTTVRGVLSTVMATIDTVHGMSTTLQNTAGQTSEQGATVASAARQSAANVETVAAAAEQLGSSVQEISRQVADTASIASEAVGGIQAANGTIDGLDVAARRIGEIVGMITAIAGQTNLLALNATIEAARAGEAGKGFAVVANEVKHLANQTAKATDEIAAQIGGIQSISRDAVTAIRSVRETIDRVNSVVSSIASAVEEQSAATQEIVRNVQQAAMGNEEITRNIGDVSTAAFSTGQLASDLLGAANGLRGDAETLDREVSDFLVSVHAR